MRVARQTGGKSLLASNDANTDTTTARAPKAPCLSGKRDNFASHLSWVAPDNGGSEITTYRIFRRTPATTTFTLIGQASGKTSYDDTTADPAVAHYIYAVRAVNAIGVSGLSNAVDLTVDPLSLESACSPPGLTKLTDPSGDTSATLINLVPTPAPPGADLLSFQIAQPYAADNTVRLVFTINTDAGQSPQPPGTAWYVSMKIPGPDPAIPGDTSTVHYRAVHMRWDGPTPVFESYTPGESNGGTVDGRFVEAGTEKPAEPTSGYAPPYDKVVIVVKASDLGLAPGSTISGFVSGVTQTAGGVITGLYDQMPNSLAYTGNYTVTSNQTCRPNADPTAILTATPVTGPAPLTVKFDGSGSYDPDTDPPADTIASYKFEFGDGSAPVTQSTPIVYHTYNTPGRYIARLTVTDSRGAMSTNNATATITVNGRPDLVVSNLTNNNNQAKQGDKVTLTATITNIGNGNAAKSRTEFLLDGKTVLGTVDTPALSPGAYAAAQINWYTANVPKGDHTVKATADRTNLVAESNETNNTRTITVTIQGNQTGR